MPEPRSAEPVAVEDAVSHRVEGSNHFGGDYVRYWRERVVTAPDGTKASTPQALLHCMDSFDLQGAQTVVDLGCGFGRMLPLLEGEGRRIVGVDISAEMVDAASHLPYAAVVRGTVEDSRLPSGWADRILCWATFDVAEQEKGFAELHRILKPGGLVLLSGKNIDYSETDEAALVAERNAFLKNFPNHFTDVAVVLTNCPGWGFAVRAAWGYRRRGDMGENRSFDLLEGNDEQYYEYVLLLEKTGICSQVPDICERSSRTMLRLRDVYEFEGELPKFLAWHKGVFEETFPSEKGGMA